MIAAMILEISSASFNNHPTSTDSPPWYPDISTYRCWTP